MFPKSVSKHKIGRNWRNHMRCDFLEELKPIWSSRPCSWFITRHVWIQIF